MVDLTADVTRFSAANPESNLYNDVLALFKEMSIHSASQKGMLIWTLQKRVEANPSCGVSIIIVLVEELRRTLESVGKSQKSQFYIPIIPMLHTLYYVVIQSGVMIPNSLYQQVYGCLMKMLMLPLPYSAVAMRTLRRIKMEITTPGCLYQRRVIAEQNLKNEHFTSQEKVFVLADPAVFSAPLAATVQAYLKVSGWRRNTDTMEKNVVLHVLQTGLQMTCQSSRLAQALEASEDHIVRKYFQKVVLAVKQSGMHGTGGRKNYLDKLEDIYTDILAASDEVLSETTKAHRGSLCHMAMPFPEINFCLWKDEEDLWKLLTDFSLRDQGKRDSGIEKDLKESDHDEPDSVPHKGPALARRKAFKSSKSADKLNLVKEKIEGVPGSSPLGKEDPRHTAKVVVMGDDRVLGRLTRACHYIRERESKHIFLTKKLNLQLYYIPVTAEEPSLSSPGIACRDVGKMSLASYLGQVDPWYNSNVNNLGAVIPTLPQLPSNHSEPTQLNLFLLDTLCYYLRCGTQPVNLPLYSVKMTRSNSEVVEEVLVSHLEADIPEFRHLREKRSKESRGRRTKSSVAVLGAVISVSYTKASLSKREVPMGAAPMTCRVVITSQPAASTSGEDYLAVSFDSVNPGYDTKIRTQNISIRTMEQRTLCVCLDKDARRTYTDVHKIEISPCLDPGCNIRSSFKGNIVEQVKPLSRYLNRVLSLPINTFTGVTV